MTRFNGLNKGRITISAFIQFTNATTEFSGFWVDTEDEALMNESRWQWFTTPNGHTYAHCTRGGQLGVKAHRLILGLKAGDPSVDHINGDGLDNRRKNLRVAGQTLNNGNRKAQKGGSSSFKGVSWDQKNQKWRARIMFDSVEIWLGRFHNAEDAARAYDEKALELFGEYAKTNEMLGLLR